MHYVSHYESPLGAMTMASDGEHLTGLWFDGQKYDRSTIDGNAELKPHLPVFTQTAQWLDAYFEGTDPGFTPPISVKGSDFKKMVSSIMLSIPFGATSTYARIAAEVARRTGRKQTSAQSFSSCRATACSPPTGACAVTREGLTARNGSWRGKASTCPACQRRQTLTTAVKGENEKADRGPGQPLKYPGDRPNAQIQGFCHVVVHQVEPSVHADRRPGRPGDDSDNHRRHRKSAR